MIDNFDYEYLTLEDRIEATKARIRIYEGKLFDCVMNAKTEAISKSNPQSALAVRTLHEQAKDLKNMIELCKGELEILTETASLETSVPDA